MRLTVSAIYTDGHLMLLEDVPLNEGDEVTVILELDGGVELDADKPISPGREATIRELMSWLEVDEEEAQEQRETFEYLKRVLDEDRLSDRKLFP